MQTKTIAKSKIRNMDRSPTLTTVLMIEKALYRYKSDKTITQIWKLLPKKVMWGTFKTTLAYLEDFGKLYIEKDKTVTWLWHPKGIDEFKKKSLRIM